MNTIMCLIVMMGALAGSHLRCRQGDVASIDFNFFRNFGRRDFGEAGRLKTAIVTNCRLGNLDGAVGKYKHDRFRGGSFWHFETRGGL